MSGTFSPWLETQLLAHTFAGVPYPVPAGLWVGLHASIPGPAGGGELAASGYTRRPTTFGPVGGVPPSTSNPAAIQWPAAPVAWGSIPAVGIYDAATGGNFLGGAALVSAADPTTPAATPIGQGDAMRIPAGSLIVGFVLATGGAASLVAPVMGAEVIR